jgi:hypothetical protein
MKLLRIVILSMLLTVSLFAQEETAYEDSIEVYVIDSFSPPDNPEIFILSFFTSEPAKSKVILDGKYEFDISTELSESHRIEINLTEHEFTSQYVPYIIYVEDSLGNINRSEKYDLEIREEIILKGDSNIWLLCLFGGTVFLLPHPVLVITEEETYFSLTKEIALMTFRGSLRYPLGYIAAEYSHIFGAPERNFVRLGYKHFIEVPGIQYILPGLNGFTNFKGFNGISPELSVGWFKLAGTFTIYTRYRYNFKPGESGRTFHEISLGLYSSFFSFYF